MPRLPNSSCIHCQRASGSLERCPDCGAVQHVRGYVVERVLAVGPRGRVYLARKDEKQVALKELVFATVPEVSAIDLFERECEVLARLSHPLVPRFVESFQDGEGIALRLFLAHAYVPGESLEARLAHQPFDEREARRIAWDVLGVLEYLHGHSPRHVRRDIKPANIIAQPDGRFALVDFGSVPQLAREAREADERSDLYALGMTLARILSRRSPEELLSGVSEEFAEFIEMLATRDPAGGFPDAANARTALGHLNGSTLELPVLQQLAPLPQPSPELQPLLPYQSPAPAELSETLPVRTVQPWRLRIGTEYFTLEPGRAYVVGREDDCDVHVDERLNRASTVSRYHLRLTVTAGGLEVEELGSSNGTFAGETFLKERGTRVTLKERAQLQMGRVVTEVAPRPLDDLRVGQDADDQLFGYHGGDPNGVRIVFVDALRRRSSTN